MRESQKNVFVNECDVLIYPTLQAGVMSPSYTFLAMSSTKPLTVSDSVSLLPQLLTLTKSIWVNSLCLDIEPPALVQSQNIRAPPLTKRS